LVFSSVISTLWKWQRQKSKGGVIVLDEFNIQAVFGTMERKIQQGVYS
jgi:hypothetical protein